MSKPWKVIAFRQLLMSWNNDCTGYLLGFVDEITELDMTANDEELGDTSIASVTRTIWVWNCIDVGLKGIGGSTCVEID